MRSPKKPKEAIQNQIRVVRDTTFVRATVDRVIAMPLGSDVELACLQVGASILEIQDHGEREQLTMSPHATEVARIRMDWSGAIDMVMSIVSAGVESNKIEKKEILQFFTDNLTDEVDEPIEQSK